MDPVGTARVNGTVRRREVPGIPRRRGHAVAAARARRRARRRLVRLPDVAPRAAVRAARRRARRARLHRRRRGAGAGATLVSRPVDGAEVATAIVSDTAAALMDLAAWARAALDVPVVGITGSVGKTSTKDLSRPRSRRPAGDRQRAQLQQRAGSAGHDPRRPRRRRGAGGRDGHARVRRDRPTVRRRPADGRGGHVGRRGAHRTESAGSKAWREPRASWSSALPATARRSSTPTTRAWRRWRASTAAAVVTYGADRGSRRAHRRAVASTILPAPVPVRSPWGRAEVRAGGQRRAHGVQRGRRAGGRRRGRGRRRRAAAALGRAEVSAMRMEVARGPRAGRS